MKPISYIDKFGDEEAIRGCRTFATSPLGNNSVEATAPGHAPVDDTTPRGVPLVFDSITGNWVSKLSRVNQEDREVSLDVARITNDDQTFLKQVGFLG